MSVRKTQVNTMGTWKLNTTGFKKDGKRPSRTFATSPARVYVAIPPKEGWPGGEPEKNGYKRRGGK